MQGNANRMDNSWQSKTCHSYPHGKLILQLEESSYRVYGKDLYIVSIAAPKAAGKPMGVGTGVQLAN